MDCLSCKMELQLCKKDSYGVTTLTIFLITQHLDYFIKITMTERESIEAGIIEQADISDNSGYVSNARLTRKTSDAGNGFSGDLPAAAELGSGQLVHKKRCEKFQPKGETLLAVLTIAGVLIGILLGFTIRTAEPSETAKVLVAFPGELLMRMLKMLIIPVIVTSIVTGLASLDLQKSGRLGIQAVIYYLATTTMAVVLGIVLVTAIHPGNPRQRDNLKAKEARDLSTLDTYLDLFRNLFPDNIIAACFEVAQTNVEKVLVSPESNETENLYNFSSLNSTDSIKNLTDSSNMKIRRKLGRAHNPNVLGVITFFLAFGVTLSSLGEKGKPVADLFRVFNEIFMKMIMLVIWYSPVGICSLIAGNILKLDNLEEIGESIGLYMVTVILGLIIHGVVVLPLVYFVMTRQNPYKFAYKTLQPILTALGTSSSAGTLPVTMKCLENKLGIDKRVTQFVLPIGATMNMDGTALLEGVASITIAQMYDVSLSFGQIITISVTATVASIGAAAIPSAGLVTLLLVLTAIGIPTEAVGMLWSIDWFLDRLRTAVNVFGDCIGAGIVYHRNREHLKLVDSKEKLMKNSVSGVIIKEETALL